MHYSRAKHPYNTDLKSRARQTPIQQLAFQGWAKHPYSIHLHVRAGRNTHTASLRVSMHCPGEHPPWPQNTTATQHSPAQEASTKGKTPIMQVILLMSKFMLGETHRTKRSTAATVSASPAGRKPRLCKTRRRCPGKSLPVFRDIRSIIVVVVVVV